MNRDFDARFERAVADGRPLVVGRETRIVLSEPFVLAAETSGDFLELAIRRVTLFALILSAIVTVLVLVRAAPRPVIALAAAWFVPAVLARWFAARRRRQLGRTLVDFELSTVVHAPVGRPQRTFSLETSVLHVEESNDGEAPRWLILRPVRGGIVRLGRGTEDDIDRCLYIFRKYRIKIVKLRED